MMGIYRFEISNLITLILPILSIHVNFPPDDRT